MCNQKNPSAKDPQLIFLKVIFSRESSLKYTTGKKCAPSDWSPKAQRARPCENQIDINDRLDNLESKVNEVLLDWQKKRKDVNLNELKNALQRFDGKKAETGDSLLSYLTHHRDIVKSKGLPSYKTLGSTVDHLKAYEKLHGQVSIYNVDMEFLNKWTHHLTVKGYSKIYIWGMVKNIKWTMTAAQDDGYEVDLPSRFKASQEEVYNIYLSVPELMAMDEVTNLPDKYLRSRDVFLIAAFTGLRYSDFSRISFDNINDGMLTIIQKKTGGKVTVPLHPIVLGILDKYENFPKVVTQQVLNRYLKKVAREAKITEMVSKTRTQGGKRKTEEIEKCELVTTHTARRSFATNAYLADVPIISIMALTGHKTVSAFLNYIKVTEKEIADSLKNHYFFLDETR